MTYDQDRKTALEGRATVLLVDRALHEVGVPLKRQRQ